MNRKSNNKKVMRQRKKRRQTRKPFRNKINIVDNEGLFIESWSGSAGYSAEMLTEDGKSWRVEDESTLASSVNIEAEYPAPADHEEIA